MGIDIISARYIRLFKGGRKMKRPVIGISCPWSVETGDNFNEPGGYYYVGRPYVQALFKYGATPMLIAPEYTEDSLDEYLDNLIDTVDGLLFTGNEDIVKDDSKELPTLKGEQPIRYEFESALMKKAYEHRLPILGICRGLDMIVENFQGSLSDELMENHDKSTSKGEACHQADINPESKLYNMVDVETLEIDSSHVFQIGKVPRGFIISAMSKDGVIEGIEAVNYPFLMGFQFHPEKLDWKDEHVGEIFKSFIKAAGMI